MLGWHSAKGTHRLPNKFHGYSSRMEHRKFTVPIVLCRDLISQKQDVELLYPSGEVACAQAQGCEIWKG